MSRLPFNIQGTPSQADIIQLLHDEVVSLCKKNYSTFSGLEIDGIICISILDTREQQVVKIHQTLKSVTPDIANGHKRQKVSHPGNWLSGQQPLVSENSSPLSLLENRNYQDDINTLSNLLKESNAAISGQEASREESVSKKSKRKRKDPVQRQKVNEIKDSIDNVNPFHLNDTQAACPVKAHEYPDVDKRLQNAPGINPFIHKDVLKVKEELVDPEYSKAENTEPKILEISSVFENIDRHASNLAESDILHEKAVPSETESRNERTGSSVKNQESINNDKMEEENEMTVSEEDAFREVEVKVEKIQDDEEYGILSDSFQNEYTGASSSAGDTGGNNSEIENTEYQSDLQTGDVACARNDALIRALELQGKSTDNSRGNSRDRKARKERRQMQGKSWIEMVKQNVNKYQAALARSTGNKNSETPVPEIISSIAKSSKSLVALLQQPASLLPKKLVSTSLDSDYDRYLRGSSVPANDQAVVLPAEAQAVIPSRSLSSSPVIKIEVDEEANHEIYSKRDGETPLNIAPVSNIAPSNPQIKDILTNKGPSGKLESRYPALFSHLQQARHVPKDNQEPSESLVNRLPFISFQELFSHAATGSPLPRMSESATVQLLEQARINPSPRSQALKGQRRTWNWKKRQVRPKDSNGRVISSVPVVHVEDKKKDNTILLGFGKRRPYSKKGKKSSEESDKDWNPEVEPLEADSDSEVIQGVQVNPGRRTRLSCGEKPRINFAELDNSDVEIEEEETAETMPMSYKQSRNQQSLEGFLGSGHAGGRGSDQEQFLFGLNTYKEHVSTAGGASTSSANDYKCFICGLEFNQNYRWQYHMIKVHNIRPDFIKQECP